MVSPSTTTSAQRDINIIDITIDGETKGRMTYDGEKYQSSIRPKAGEHIAISTTVDGKTISAEDVMPEETTTSKNSLSLPIKSHM